MLLTRRRDGFTARLAVLLQLSVDNMSTDVPLVELGADSLVAVEVRSWFLKNVDVDVPLLKVLGGSSLLDIVEVSLEQALPKLLPEVSEDRLGNNTLPAVEEEESSRADFVADRSTEGSSSSAGEMEQSSSDNAFMMTPPPTPHSKT